MPHHNRDKIESPVLSLSFPFYMDKMSKFPFLFLGK